MIGPVPASRKALAKAGLTIDDMDVIEINEASPLRHWPARALVAGCAQ